MSDALPLALHIIFIAVLILLLVLTVYMEIGLYFLNKRFLSDAAVDKDGKMDACKLPNMGCC